MARAINKLSARTVDSLEAPGRYSDGGNLFLVIGPGGSKKWTFLYRWQGKPTEMGLGSAARGQTTLAKARELAGAARAQLSNGVSPLDAKREFEREAAIEKKAVPTFGVFSEKLVDTIETGFRNAKHRQQWRNTLKTYCTPIWEILVSDVNTDGVLKCLTPIWSLRPETASRLRGRIERVIDAARAQDLFKGENPARWKGHLAATLPKPKKLSRGHHAALAYDELPAFMAQLRESEGLSALCLEFTILTAARSGEALNAKWSEMDLDTGLWTIPAERMKAGKEHRVPLVGRAKAIVEALAKVKTGEYVFPGHKPIKPLSVMSLAMTLRRMGRDTITVHGFRSAFSDWASEATSFSAETREACLAHTIANKAEAAYRRGDQIEKRKLMMEAWGKQCSPKSADNVVIMQAAKQGSAA